jgi:hypothetical protein
MSTDLKVVQKQMMEAADQAVVDGAKASDAEAFKTELNKQVSFMQSCMNELAIRAKNGKDWTVEFSKSMWNKLKDLVGKVFGYCKDMYTKVKNMIMGMFA